MTGQATKGPTPREQVEALLRAAGDAGWLTEPHSVRAIRSGSSGLLPWRIETPLALIGATWRDAAAQLARIPLQAPLAPSGLRQGPPAVQRKLALAKPLGEALDPTPLERTGPFQNPVPLPAPQDGATTAPPPRSLVNRWRTLFGGPEEPEAAGPPPAPPAPPPVWPLAVTLGGQELGDYLQTQARLQAMLEWPEVAGDTQLSYRVRAALHDLLPETRTLYLALPPSLRRPAEFAAALERLLPAPPQGEAQRRWEAHQRFLRERQG
ncbi:hypothetical protein ACINK0_14605 [Deinococcus sp. VB343]|uniref:Uncharacterized protein n=1 Tax=Deinococcus sp. VB142 TaxID=3112952 RepID=A0AAU6Q739_9DEIO